VKEVKGNRMGAVLVAQPLLAVGVLRSPLIHKFVEPLKPAQPRVAVLHEPSESFVGRGFSCDIRFANIVAFRP